MRLDSYARYALIGALAISLACARNTEEDMDDTTSGRVSETDTGATVRVRPDTTAMDTVGKMPADTVRPSMDTTAMPPSPDTTVGTPPISPTPDSARIGGADTSAAAPGWPSDSTQGGWSTPPDSVR